MALPSLAIATKGLLPVGTTPTITIASEGLLYSIDGGGGGGPSDGSEWLIFARRRGSR